jgi:hypothetical protein
MPNEKGPTAAELKSQVSLRDVVSGVVKLEKRGGEYWACCPFHSEKTASFAIKQKEDCEVFFCQGCGASGDVITFIEMHEKCTKAEAFKKVRELAGNTAWREEAKKVQEAFVSVVDKPKTVLPFAGWEKKEAALLANAAAMKYLIEERGIGIETVKALHFGFNQSTKATLKPEEEQARDAGWICFPRVVGDKIVAVKMRSIVMKAFAQLTGMDAKALFNTETINALSGVFVTEGEFDTAIFEQAGFSAVSIPNATTKITPEWKVLLKNAAFVVLAGDNDGKAGSDKMRLLLNELGENTFLLLWPDGAKDSNDFFRNQCNRDIDVFRHKVDGLVELARSSPVEGFMSLIQRLRSTAGTDGENDPFRLHFAISALDKMAYVPVTDGGYFIIYSTYSGTGKSVFTTQIMIDEAKRGEVVVVYSPELSGSSYLALVAAQTLPERNLNRSLVVTQADYNATADVLDKPTENGNPFQYYVGHVLPSGDPLEFIESTLKIIRPTRFVIDTFPCVVVRGRGESMVDAESRTAETLSGLGKKYGCIFAVIGQSNKEAEDLKEKRKDAHGVLRGSRVLYDKAHAIYLLHRKKKVDGTGQDDLLESDTLVKMEKNRTAGPGAQQIYLTYVRTRSRFYLQERSQAGSIEKSTPDPPPDNPIGDLPY